MKGIGSELVRVGRF